MKERNNAAIQMTEISQKALSQFSNDWQSCPIRVHIKTLMALIRGNHIEWRNRIPFVYPELFQWKVNCEFRLAQSESKANPEFDLLQFRVFLAKLNKK